VVVEVDVVVIVVAVVVVVRSAGGVWKKSGSA
jgi:hypothetical protein